MTDFVPHPRSLPLRVCPSCKKEKAAFCYERGKKGQPWGRCDDCRREAARQSMVRQREKKKLSPVLTELSKQYMQNYNTKNRETINQKQVERERRDRLGARLKRLGLSDDCRQKITTHEGNCDICGETGDGRWQELSIDHCHTRQVFRGMLCSRCNRGLGYFKDRPDLLRQAAEYLERSQTPV